ncbi:hypothetical protein ACQP2F_33410 [Actinoplanes sp. CA-030573]|uniref:hypothetical protein n=1 Tax=Actinoplanes sp. CA-030573 TaxID=3239898 RepID=UPI003D8CDF85
MNRIATATTLDHATVWSRLPIPGRRPIDIRERAAANATITYRFAGVRAAGALTIVPTFANDLEAIPTAIRIRLGIPGPQTDCRSETRTELPVINGVTLHGEIPAINPAEYLARTRPRLYFSRTGSRELSDATNDYFCQILNAIIGSYLKRPQTSNERRAVAIRTAAGRLTRLEHQHIASARAALDLQLYHLAALDLAADDLRHLTQHPISPIR